MWEKVLAGYCERAGRPDFWAEPLNAVTNGAFIVAGIALLALLWRDARSGGRPQEMLSWLLAALIVVIGIGSFLFHTLAVRWTGLADVLPIFLFMLTAVFAVARRAFGAPAWASLLAAAGFFGLMVASFQLRGLITDHFLRQTLGGLFGYGPALLVLLGSGALLIAAAREPERRAAGGRLAAAGIVFMASLAFRTVDKPLCDVWTIGDVKLGVHFLWHLLNALTLYLTASALIGLAPSRRAA
ncbi:MAG: ceramidase [Neomegalonema sp.]|nr:ceramidase [Neomegalonema sp.]